MVLLQVMLSSHKFVKVLFPSTFVFVEITTLLVCKLLVPPPPQTKVIGFKSDMLEKIPVFQKILVFQSMFVIVSSNKGNVIS